jgi:hypothetical protein
MKVLYLHFPQPQAPAAHPQSAHEQPSVPQPGILVLNFGWLVEFGKGIVVCERVESVVKRERMSRDGGAGRGLYLRVARVPGGGVMEGSARTCSCGWARVGTGVESTGLGNAAL